MRKFASVLCAVALLVMVLNSAGAVSWAAKVELVMTPEGEIGIEYERYLALEDSQREIVGKMLAFLLANPQSYQLNHGKIQFDLGSMPEELHALAKIWRGSNVAKRENAAGTKKTGEGVSVLNNYPYWWYTWHHVNTTSGHSAQSKHCHSLPNAYHSIGTEELKCSRACEQKASGSITVTGGIPQDLWSAEVTLNYTYSLIQYCSVSLTSMVPPGQTHSIYWCWLRHWQDAKYNKFYWEDWDENGTPDYCLFVGQCSAYATSVSNGNFDLTTAPNPCQQPCASIHCPYR